MLAAGHEYWGLSLGNHVCVPAPGCHLGSAPNPRPPRRSNWIRLDHLRPYTFTCSVIILVLASYLAIPIRSELLVGLRVHGRAIRRQRNRCACGPRPEV